MANNPKSDGKSKRAKKIEIIKPTVCPAILPVKSHTNAFKLFCFKFSKPLISNKSKPNHRSEPHLLAHIDRQEQPGL